MESATQGQPQLWVGGCKGEGGGSDPGYAHHQRGQAGLDHEAGLTPDTHSTWANPARAAQQGRVCGQDPGAGEHLPAIPPLELLPWIEAS